MNSPSCVLLFHFSNENVIVEIKSFQRRERERERERERDE